MFANNRMASTPCLIKKPTTSITNIIGHSQPMQDVFDLIDLAVATLGADPDRVYLTGFSYGGRGTYIIGLKNPDRFAALAPMGPPTDMYEIDVRRPDSDGCSMKKR